MPTVTVRGIPRPKGSLKCIGSRGRGGHQLIEDHRPGQKEWRESIAKAGAALLAANGGPYTGPVSIRAVFTIPRPKTVPVTRRWWPYRKNAADIDKLARMVLDGLADAGLYADDVQVVHLETMKTYPDTPVTHPSTGMPLTLPPLRHPGAIITARRLPED